MHKAHGVWILTMVALLILLPIIASPAEVKVSASGWSSERSHDAPAMRTTLMQLLSNPVPLDRHAVRVIGVLSVDFEDHRLYFSKEFYDAFLPQYAIELRLPSGAAAASKRFQGKYVVVEGTFKAQVDAMSSGAIEVTSLEVAEEPRRGRIK